MRQQSTETAAYFVQHVEERRMRALNVPNAPPQNRQVRIWLTADKKMDLDTFSVGASRPSDERLKAILGELPKHAAGAKDSPLAWAFEELEERKARFREFFAHGLAYEFCDAQEPPHHEEDLLYCTPVPGVPGAPPPAMGAVPRKKNNNGGGAAATAAAAAAGAAVDEGGGPSPKPQEPKLVKISVEEWRKNHKPVDPIADLRRLSKLAKEAEEGDESETFRPG